MILNKENTFTEQNRFLVYSDQLNATRKQILDTAEEMISRSAIQTFEDEGETVTATDASYLASLTVDGEAVQDGTPTPSAPVPIEVVEGRNLFGAPIAGYISGSANTFNQLSGVGGSDGTAFVAEIPSNTTFTISVKLFTGMNRFRVSLFDDDPRSGEQFATGHFSQLINTSNPATDQTYTFSSGEFTWVVLGLSTSATAFNLDAQAQLETGSAATPYVVHGAIGLVVGNTAASINLQGNVLASLPDGTKDVLTVDSVGHCEIEKHIGYIASYNGESVGDNYISTTGELSAGASVYYELATAQTIDCGYIDMPAITDGSTISITAQVIPTIAIKWWTKNQNDVAAAFGAVSSNLAALQSEISALDARVTALESSNAKSLVLEKLETSKEVASDDAEDEQEEVNLDDAE